jgi:hypothetical protein
MNHILKYGQFEALSPSQFREYVKVWQDNPNLKERYKSMFEDYKKKYSGDKNAYRIYLPLSTGVKKSEFEDDISKFLFSNGWTLVDYIDGKARFGQSKNTKRIGQVFSQIERNSDEAKKDEIKRLLKGFVEDPIRKQGKGSDLLVCISRHPYDVAGADTNRGWENCMTIGTGANYKYLIHDVKEGSLVAYLINSDDKNINKPIANCAIKPYINSKDKTDVILLRDSKTYPQPYPDFENTVSSWLDEVNGKKEGIYCFNPKLYKDIFGSSYINIKELNPHYIKKICSIYDIKGIKINPDLSINVKGDVDLSDKNLQSIPLKFSRVEGNFWINDNNLRSLAGSPEWVGGDFFVYNNNLSDLIGGPQIVKGEYSAQSNKITSISGFPIEVGSHFDLSYNKDFHIKQKDIPTKIGGKFIQKS